MKKLPRYSFAFFKRTLQKTIILIAALSLLLFLLFTAMMYRSNLSYVQGNVNAENEKAMLQVNDVLENCTRICMFFAQYRTLSSIYQAQSDLDLQRAILEEEISTYLACFDYIAGIEINTGDKIVSHISDDAEFVDVGTYNRFDISFSPEKIWPRLLQLRYTANTIDTYSVRIQIHAKYLYKQFFLENTYCITDDGTIILSAGGKDIGKNITELTSCSLKALKNGKHTNNFAISTKSFAESKLYLVTLQQNHISGGLESQIMLLLLTSAFIFCVSVFLHYRMMQRIYQPVKRVVDVFKYYLPREENIAEEDILFISECLEDEEMEEATRSAVLQIRKSQLYALHSQISPHFMGNSLDIIKWKALQQLGMKHSIGEALGIMSYFLSETQKYSKMFSSIDEEISRTKQYTHLVSLCYNSDLRVDWNVEEGCLPYSIISLTLQPFIENSVLHAFSNPEKERLAEIAIDIHSLDKNIEIIISDNGDGMSKHTLSEIRSMLLDDEPCDHHIGIKNTHLKYRILHGEKYGITNISSDSNGTTFRLLLPKRYLPASPRKF